MAESSAMELKVATTYEMCETMTGEIEFVMIALKQGLRKLLSIKISK